MRILIENGCHGLKNMGDVAMLQVAVNRLRNLWPHALIEVVVEDPVLLKRYCPEANPVDARGHYLWFFNRNLLGRFHRFLPRNISNRLEYIEDLICHRFPLAAQSIISYKRMLRGLDSKGLRSFLNALYKADLVVMSGGGDLSDAFEQKYAIALLDVLKMASQCGKTTAMFGQGLGPITNSQSKLMRIGKTVLPKVDIICIREKRVGPAHLDSFNVEQSRRVITGDDAIELAYEARVAEFGSGIGLNLRIAQYSEVDKNLLEIIRVVLHNAARKYNAPLIPVPISFQENESDTQTIQCLLAGYDDTSDGGQLLDTPLKVINQVGHCRIVVTGSYHSAVFALAQGIPVAGLIKSEYYKDKFLGLADQFGAGCNVVFLQDKFFNEKLMVAIEDAWNSAVHIRPQLLEAAKRQIESGKSAYRRLYNLVESRKS